MADLFDGAVLPAELEARLRDTNPWWVGKPGPRIPEFRRTTFRQVARKVESGITPCVVVRGPRQVGKTTLQQQLIEHLTESQAVRPTRILRVQFDDMPQLPRKGHLLFDILRWFQHDVLGCTLNESARAGELAYVFLDEVQNLPKWAPSIKSLVDHHDVRVVVTGSSSLRIGMGEDSLAGRITYVDMGPLSLQEISGLRYGTAPSPVIGENDIGRLGTRGFWEDVVAQGNADRAARGVRAFVEKTHYNGAFGILSHHARPSRAARPKVDRDPTLIASLDAVTARTT